MAVRCQVCRDGKGEAVNALMLAGWSRVRMAEELGLPYQSVKNHIQRHGPQVRTPAPSKQDLDTMIHGPAPLASAVETFAAAFGHEPMEHQVEYLGETANLVFLKARQVGATEAAAGLAIHTARSRRGALIVLVAPSQRQSSEIAMRARLGLMTLGENLIQDSATVIRLDNGSRIVSLPGTDRGVRGYPADLLILDEAAWIPDLTWHAARATVAATGGRVVVQSTPGVEAGFYYDLVETVPPGWNLMRVKAEDCPTIDPEFLAAERAHMDPVLFAQEYEATFAPPGGGRGLFSADQIEAMKVDGDSPFARLENKW